MEYPKRIIGRYEGNEPGPLFLCIGAMHGNEPAGVQAIGSGGRTSGANERLADPPTGRRGENYVSAAVEIS